MENIKYIRTTEEYFKVDKLIGTWEECKIHNGAMNSFNQINNYLIDEKEFQQHKEICAESYETQRAYEISVAQEFIDNESADELRKKIISRQDKYANKTTEELFYMKLEESENRKLNNQTK